MNTKLKSLIEEAIQKTLDNCAEQELWDGYIHPRLVQQMTTAAEQVMTAAMEAQEYAKQEAGE